MTDTTPLPLPIYPWPLSEERMALIREAKSRIDSPIKVVPVPAAYGSPGRVLCFGAIAPFLCRSIPIRPENVDNVDSIEAALRAWLDPWLDVRLFDEAWQLSSWLGCNVTLSHEEDDYGVKFV